MSIQGKLAAALTVAGALVLAAAGPVLAKDAVHHVAVHIDDSNPQHMNLVLNNVNNIRQFYADHGDKAVVEIVAYGPGLKMYTADSPVKDRISSMALEDKDLQFSACQNTLNGMEKKAGKKIALLPEATMVPSGAIRLIELQEKGYKYLRP